ncbi:response regulator [bacterium]|nr:MAG: response regulator [bacterium]
MAGSQKKILAVEDHAETAELLQMELDAIGYPATSVVANGIEALRKAYEEKPDLILLDILIPGMNGLEVARRLKADPLTRSILILAVTAKAMPGDREKCLESGCDGYLAKPYLHQKLKEEIEKLLSKATVKGG